MNELIEKPWSGNFDPPGPRQHVPRILCADDELAICDSYAKVLTRHGYSVVTVPNGKLAWDALDHEPFDLLITDNQMPCLTGVELVLKVRGRGLNLPIICAASELDFFLAPANRWLEVDRVLQKPFSLNVLISMVGHVLHRHQ